VYCKEVWSLVILRDKVVEEDVDATELKEMSGGPCKSRDREANEDALAQFVVNWSGRGKARK